MDRSTSWHRLNSDKGLSPPSRLLWFLLNWINNRFPRAGVDPELEIRFYRSGSPKSSLISAEYSPSRSLCNMFWHDLPWHELAESLGTEVRALEVGCGTGIYGTLLEECLGNALGRYTGLDLFSHAEWERFEDRPEFEFFQADSGETGRYLEDKNLIITQSAIEHFEEDLQYFRQVSEYVTSVSHPVVQIHLMPSAACLYTYLWHGVRYYSPRTLSKITRLFGKETHKALVSLGASNCNRVHRRFITFPNLLGRGDRRKAAGQEYTEDLEQAIQRDQEHPDLGSSSFYALVLQSNTGRPVSLPFPLYNRNNKNP